MGADSGRSLSLPALVARSRLPDGPLPALSVRCGAPGIGRWCRASKSQGVWSGMEEPVGGDALDIEWRRHAATVRTLRDAAKQAGAAALFSEHHFDGTPDTHAMTEALHGMLDAGADIAKLAVMPHSRADAARLLLATAQVHDARPEAQLITMSMGRLGAVTRYCGGAFGSGATFGTLSAASAPGQPRAGELRGKLVAEG